MTPAELRAEAARFRAAAEDRLLADDFAMTNGSYSRLVDQARRLEQQAAEMEGGL